MCRKHYLNWYYPKVLNITNNCFFKVSIDLLQSLAIAKYQEIVTPQSSTQLGYL